MVSDNKKETILLIHGTFASSKTGVTQWYQRESSFCSTLNDQLKSRGSQAKCWTHLQANDSEFQWTGENSWIEWANAAKRLYETLEQLIDAGWICHIVAHSHGGQVLLQAIHQLKEDKYHHGIGSLVLLGTPLFKVSVASSKFPSRNKKIVLLCSFLWISYVWIYRDVLQPYAALLESTWYWVILGIVCLAVVVVLKKLEFKFFSPMTQEFRPFSPLPNE